MTLLEINRKIANSTIREEFEYWRARREEFYRVGADFVNETIEEDKRMGILTEKGEFRSEIE